MVLRLLVVGCVAVMVQPASAQRASAQATEAAAPRPAAERRPTAKRGPVRSFVIREGSNTNHFYQSPRVATHTILRSGATPRIIVATPAGNSGWALWFKGASKGQGKLSASELWTWNANTGRVRAVPFGVSEHDTDESNAVQLWSNTR